MVREVTVENVMDDRWVGDVPMVHDDVRCVGCTTRLGCARNYNATWEGNTDNRRVELYDLASDPQEKNDISEEPDHQATVEKLFKRIQFHLRRAVTPLHKEFDSSGLPLYSFPPGQYYTGWCDGQKYENLKNSTAF